MKTIIIPVTTNFFTRNYLHSGFISKIAKTPEVQIVLVVPGRLRSDYEKIFAELDNIRLVEFPHNGHRLADKIFKFIETSSISTHTRYMQMMSEFFRLQAKHNFLVRWSILFTRLGFFALGKFRFWRVFIRWSYGVIPSRTFAEILNEYQPDLVFSPTMLYDDYRILKEAKQRGIKTAGIILSWDNLYSKSLLRVHPDQLFVHTEVLKQQAASLGDYPASHILVTGVLQYDRYFNRDQTKTDCQAFRESVGFKKDEAMILYALSGKAGLDIDFVILKLIRKIIDSGQLERKANVLIRPYPKVDFSVEKLERLQAELGFVGQSSVAHFAERDDWEFDEQSLNLLEMQLQCTDIVITMYSTFFIEGAIFDKPLIGIAFDGDLKRDYWNSAKRFFDWDHLRDIKTTNGIDLVRTENELKESLNLAIKNPGQLQLGRESIVKMQCEFTDGKASWRLASAISKLLSQETDKTIHANI
ncbi:MAG: CDP-glycerol glycerophosphotransferase family protein [Candidatus Paceibacterota bacterium]|jgi:CDP-glycerol glycerophosphotransferase (TagB/SpsB family)